MRTRHSNSIDFIRSSKVNNIGVQSIQCLTFGVGSALRSTYERDGVAMFIPADGAGVGRHGLIGSNTVDGYYLSYCAGASSGCEDHGKDYVNFSTNGDYPSSAQVVPCGFYNYSTEYWDDCPEGDNEHRMRLYIRY